MELYFCSVCGISIPQTEIEGGVAVAQGGKHLCSEHRPAKGDSPPPASDAADPPSSANASPLDVELLFCANCRVSIPEGDARSGRAHREFGSLLCSVCSRAVPGERAARRDAVEAELADSEDDDLLRAPRMAVAVSSTPTTTSSSPRGESTSIAGVVTALVIVGLVFAGVGWALGSTMFGGEEQDAEMAALRSSNDDLAEQIEALKKRLDNADSSRNDIAVQLRDDGAAERKRVETLLRGEVADSLRTMRQETAALKGELTGSDARLQASLAKLEGQLEGLNDIVKMLGNRPVNPPPVEPPDGGRIAPPPPVEPVQPEKPAVNPKVAKHIRDLLESAEEAERFPAATELGRLGDESAIPALAYALGNDSHYLVRRACARSLGTLRAWNAVPALIAALEEKESYVAQQANFALQNITGEDFGVSQDMTVSQRRSKAKAANKWWDKNGGTPPAGVSLNPVELDRPK